LTWPFPAPIRIAGLPERLAHACPTTNPTELAQAVFGSLEAALA
jgi:hypothetical protein